MTGKLLPQRKKVTADWPASHEPRRGDVFGAGDLRAVLVVVVERRMTDPMDTAIWFAWNKAEAKRMQRTPEDIEARDRILARCRIRCLLAKIRMR